MRILERGWKHSRLGDYFKIKHGFAFKGGFFADKGQFILLTPGNFRTDGGIKLKGDREKYYVGEFPDEYLLRRGEMLVVMTDLKQSAPILGSPAIMPEDGRFLHNQRLGKIVELDESRMEKGFLYYLFNSYSVRSQIKATATGATVRHTAPDRIYAVEVYVPPLPTQRKIAAILSAYDGLIENNTRRIAILEEMAQLLYREWFVYFRFPGHEDVEMVDSELGRIPEGWEIVSFTDIVDVLTGGTPRTKVPEYWGGPIPFFSPRDIRSSCYVVETERSITELGLENCSSDLYPRDTVFITARGTVGNVVMPAVPMAMNQTCYALRGRNGIDQYFVFLNIQEQVERLRRRAYGAVFDTIIIDTFRRLRVVKPPLSLIQQCHNLVSPVFDQILNLLNRNIVLCRTRDLLLPRLISGELDVSRLGIDTEGVER